MIVVRSIAAAAIVRLLSSMVQHSSKSTSSSQWLTSLIFAANALLLIQHSFSLFFHSIGRLHHLKKWFNWSNRQLFLDGKSGIVAENPSVSSAVDGNTTSAVACASPNARHVLHSKLHDSYFVTKQRQLLGISYFCLAHYLLLCVVRVLINERTTLVSTTYFDAAGTALLLLSLTLEVRVQWRYIVREVNIMESTKLAVAIALCACAKVDMGKHSFTTNIAASMPNCLVQLPADITLQGLAFEALALLLEVRIHWFECGYFPLFDRMFSSSIGYDEVSQLAVDIRSLEVALVESYQSSSSSPDGRGRNALISRGEDVQREVSGRILLAFVRWFCNIAALLCLLASLAEPLFFLEPSPLLARSADIAMRIALLLAAIVDLVATMMQQQATGADSIVQIRAMMKKKSKRA